MLQLVNNRGQGRCLPRTGVTGYPETLWFITEEPVLVLVPLLMPTTCPGDSLLRGLDGLQHTVSVGNFMVSNPLIARLLAFLCSDLW